MAAISVTPDQLRASANVYSTAANEIQTQLNNISTENGNMAAEWQGQAFQGYLDQFEQLKPNVNQMIELLTQINQQLHNYANTVEDRDNQDRTAFGLN